MIPQGSLRCLKHTNEHLSFPRLSKIFTLFPADGLANYRENAKGKQTRLFVTTCAITECSV